MLKDNADQFRIRLEKLGLSGAVISAAWPTWWSEDADASPSARAELRYSLARKLGLEPHSLLQDESDPDFVWTSTARFKHLSGESDIEKWALTSFGTALGRMLLQGVKGEHAEGTPSAAELRAKILEKQPFVRLVDLLVLVWSLGIPTVHLRIFPLIQKRMAAMSVGLGSRNAILLAKDTNYPPQIAFYLAHELAHIHHKHVTEDGVLIDYESRAAETESEPDLEEVMADEFALELLTGSSKPTIIAIGSGSGPRSLAKAALEAARSVAVEPGVLAMCYGFTSQDWRTAIGSLRYIYDSPRPAWQEINKIAHMQLEWSELSFDTASYITNVLGGVD